MIGYITVPKSVAKEMIDNYPGDRVPVLSYNIETHIHKPTERKSKRRTKEIIDIAKEVGFSNNSYFCRSFREFFGDTPEACRKGIAADEKTNTEVDPSI